MAPNKRSLHNTQSKKRTAYGLKDLSVAALNPYGSRQTQEAGSEALYIAFYTFARSSPFPQILNSSFLSKSPNKWITNCISIEPFFKRVKRQGVCYMGLKGFEKYFAKQVPLSLLKISASCVPGTPTTQQIILSQLILISHKSHLLLF